MELTSFLLERMLSFQVNVLFEKQTASPLQGRRERGQALVHSGVCEIQKMK